MKFFLVVTLAVMCGLSTVYARFLGYEDYELNLHNYEDGDDDSFLQYLHRIKDTAVLDYDADDYYHTGLFKPRSNIESMDTTMTISSDEDDQITTPSENDNTSSDEDYNNDDEAANDADKDDNNTDEDGTHDADDKDNLSYIKIYTYAHNGLNPIYDFYSIQSPSSVTPGHSDETTDAPNVEETSTQISHPDIHQTELLRKVALSSTNSALLAKEYSENVGDFQLVYGNLENSMLSLHQQTNKIYSDFMNSAASRSNQYNGDEHKNLVNDMSAMLTQVEAIRSQIVEMQNVEQRLNYHLLLQAVLKEIYGETKVDLHSGPDYYL